MLQFFFLITTSLALSLPVLAADNVCLGKGDPKNSFYIDNLDSKVAILDDIDRQIAVKQEQINQLNNQIADSLDSSDSTQASFDEEKGVNDRTRNDLNTAILKEKEEYLGPREAALESWKKSETKKLLRDNLTTDQLKEQKRRLEENYKDKKEKLAEEFRQKFPKLEEAVSATNNNSLKKENKKRDAHQAVRTSIEDLQKQIDGIDGQIKNLEKKKQSLHFVDEWNKAWKTKNLEAYVCAGKDCAFGASIEKIAKLASGVEGAMVPKLDRQCVEKTLEAKAAYNTQLKCDNSSSSPRTSDGDLCVNKKMADYIQWNLNQALKCLSAPGKAIDPNLLWMKLTNESTFRFFYSYEGGQGLMQTTPIAQEEMLGMTKYGRPLGRKFLARLMHKQGKACETFKSIIDYDSEFAYDDQVDFFRDISSVHDIYNKSQMTFADKDKIKEVKDHYDNQLNELKDDYPEVAKYLLKIDTLSDLISDPEKSQKTTQDEKVRTQQAINIYIAQANQQAKKDGLPADFLYQLITTKKFLNKLSEAKNMSKDDKDNMDKIIAQEKDKLEKIKKDYPKFEQRLFNPNAGSCQFISLEEGIQRNIINGMGLFLYYRDGYYNGNNDDSVHDVIQQLLPEYRNAQPPAELSNKMATVFYGPRGNGGAAMDIKNSGSNFVNKVRAGKIDQALEDTSAYYRATMRSQKEVKDHFKEDIKCSIVSTK